MCAAGGPAPRRIGLDAEQITAQACELSRSRGLEHWSIRDLAKELDAVPSVIYHYFSNKDAILDSVIDSVSADFPLPDPNLEWKDWFTTLFMAIRPTLLEYRGLADRLIAGRITPGLAPIIDAAVAKLEEAGFGARTAFAYSMIFNVAISTIAARTHHVHGLNGVLDTETLLAAFESLNESRGTRVLVRDLVSPLVDPSTSARVSDEYFELLLKAILEGVESVLLS